jgi:hypothetical protein
MPPDTNPSFCLPWQSNVDRNIRLLKKFHHFDDDAAALTARLFFSNPEVLLAKFELLQPTMDMVQQVNASPFHVFVVVTIQQVLPQIAKQVTHMLVRHVDAACLRPILDSNLTPDFKFKVALGKLQQQKLLIASLLKFHIDVLRGRCPLTCEERDALYGDELTAALNHPDVKYLIPTLRCCVILF